VIGLGERLVDPLRSTFLIGCLALPVYAFLQLWGLMLRGFKRVVASLLPGTLGQPVLLAAGVGFVVLWGERPLEAHRAMGLNLASIGMGDGMTRDGVSQLEP